jgi:hypothetical protein
LAESISDLNIYWQINQSEPGSIRRVKLFYSWGIALPLFGNKLKDLFEMMNPTFLDVRCEPVALGLEQSGNEAKEGRDLVRALAQLLFENPKVPIQIQLRRNDIVEDDRIPLETFGTRARNCLLRAGIKSWAELCSKSPNEILSIQNLGQGALREVLEAVATWDLGMSLSDGRIQSDSSFGTSDLDQKLRKLLDRNCESEGVDLCKLGLSTRALSCLERENIMKLDLLLDMTPRDLLEITNMGVTSLQNIIGAVARWSGGGVTTNGGESDILGMVELDLAIISVLKEEPGVYMQAVKIALKVAEATGKMWPQRFVNEAISRLIDLEDDSLRMSRRRGFAWVAKASQDPRVEEMVRLHQEGKTLQEIGDHFSVSRERVRQILKAHGAPSGREIRARRLAGEREIDFSKKSAEALRVRDEVRKLVQLNGAMSAPDVSSIIGVEVGVVVRNWPPDFRAYLVRAPGSEKALRWTDDEILSALRIASIYSFPLTRADYDNLVAVGEINGPSSVRIMQRFVTWSAACDAAGVESVPAFRTNYESHWTDDDLVFFARTYLLDELFTGSAKRYNEWRKMKMPEAPSLGTLRNRLGTWADIKRQVFAGEGNE